MTRQVQISVVVFDETGNYESRQEDLLFDVDMFAYPETTDILDVVTSAVNELDRELDEDIEFSKQNQPQLFYTSSAVTDEIPF
jgi:hypothetical protein